ncbi:MAG: formate dehydrogenase accessory sulfurtransferase FdhD [Nitriliruptorales bacterium]|nr:formate dehydrogenase accessory sulfurtransferase FdhD [Nitriliruptorales bacterium]
MELPLHVPESRPRPGPRSRAQHRALDGGAPREDWVATEEPLEIRVSADGARTVTSVTMRTPGNDVELAVGFLHGEGILRSRDQLLQARYCVDRSLSEEQQYNVVTVDLRGPAPATMDRLDRHFHVTSACGVCGSQSLDDLADRGLQPVASRARFDADVLAKLPIQLSAAQDVFGSTGGLHAAALFDADGRLVEVREDVGRHNAMDKLVGWALLEDRLPLDGPVLVSGRASFELVQKAAAAGVPVLAAVSAPSSLAIETAERFGVTLIAFLRDGAGNVYTHPDRITTS